LTAGYDYALCGTITGRSDVVGAGETKRTDANTLIRAGSHPVIDYAGNSEFTDLNGPNYSSEAVKVHYSEAGNAIAAQMVYDALFLNLSISTGYLVAYF
jgi:hypothetical protein